MDIFGTVATYVTGAVMREAQEMRSQRDQDRAEVTMTVEEIRATRERYRTWFEASGRFPRIVRLMDSGLDPDDPAIRDERFQFGLDCVLRRHRRPAGSSSVTRGRTCWITWRERRCGAADGDRVRQLADLACFSKQNKVRLDKLSVCLL
jgi:hypothetical protein